MKEHPILFSSPMVQAILAGRKTMTRRLAGLDEVNASPNDWSYHGIDRAGKHLFRRNAGPRGAVCMVKCRTAPGDRLWVREAWREWSYTTAHGSLIFDQTGVEYRADGLCMENRAGDFVPWNGPEPTWVSRWRPSIHMPRKAARIISEVTAEERCERVQDISEADAMAEGIIVRHEPAAPFGFIACRYGLKDWKFDQCEPNARLAFKWLWVSIHGPGAWERNDWVRIIQFRKIKP